LSSGRAEGTDARASFSKLVAAAIKTHEGFEVPATEDRVAVMLSADDFDGLMETLDILLPFRVDIGTRVQVPGACRPGTADRAP
jgi:PHD/YefM family antitoxin component YafN of YafNO toxin-antitoxin module